MKEGESKSLIDRVRDGTQYAKLYIQFTLEHPHAVDTTTFESWLREQGERKNVSLENKEIKDMKNS